MQTRLSQILKGNTTPNGSLDGDSTVLPPNFHIRPTSWFDFGCSGASSIRQPPTKRSCSPFPSSPRHRQLYPRATNPSSTEAFFGQPPLTDVNRFRPVISKRNQRRLKAIHCKAPLRSKPNPSHSDRRQLSMASLFKSQSIGPHYPALSFLCLCSSWLIKTLSETT